MKRFTIFTFDNIEDVNDAFGYDCFEDLIQSGDYNALKPFARILKETDDENEVGAEAFRFFENLGIDVFIYDLEKDLLYN